MVSSLENNELGGQILSSFCGGNVLVSRSQLGVTLLQSGCSLLVVHFEVEIVVDVEADETGPADEFEPGEHAPLNYLQNQVAQRDGTSQVQAHLEGQYVPVKGFFVFATLNVNQEFPVTISVDETQGEGQVSVEAGPGVHDRAHAQDGNKGRSKANYRKGRLFCEAEHVESEKWVC